MQMASRQCLWGETGLGTEVVVELNEAIVPKARYGETVLHDGDQVEIVCFMGGG